MKLPPQTTYAEELDRAIESSVAWVDHHRRNIAQEEHHLAERLKHLHSLRAKHRKEVETQAFWDNTALF